MGGQLELEGDITIDACASTSGASRVGGLGIRSGKGSDNFFGRQYILETDTSSQADRLMTNLVRGYSGGCSEGDTRPLAEDSRVDTFVMTEGDLTSYIAVVRQSSTSVTVLRLNTAKTAPRSLTDATADRELARLAGLVRS